MEKALGHIFRCAFDTLDYISVSIRERIINEISPFSPDTINISLPEYYPEIKPDIERINEKIAKIRANKDVALICYDEIEEYSDFIERLKGYYQLILKNKPSLIEYEGKLKTTKRENRRFQILLVLLGAFIGALVGVLFTRLLE